MSSERLTAVNMDEQGNPTDGRGAWRQFLCRACGWIYDERYGDEDSGLPAGTRYEDIPDDWFCPVCGVTKQDFELFEKREQVVNPLISHHNNTNQSGVVVIGAGMAGWAMVEALRSQCPDTVITLITADSGNRYLKPNLSIAISQNKTIDNGLVSETGIQASQRLNINLIAHTFVMNVSTHNKQIRTTRGDFYYDKLILALGAKPALPSCLSENYVWRVNHLDMFNQLQQKLSQQAHQKVAIIGAGMIGCELAEDLARAGHQVYLLDKLALPLAEILPTEASTWMKESCTALGIQFMGDIHIQSIAKSEQYRIQYQLQQQSHDLDVDVVIASTGLMIDERLPKRLNIEYSKCGIVVNEQTLQTTNPDIFALGDCISLHGQPYRFVALLRQQAETIASQIVGHELKPYQHKAPLISLKTKHISVKVKGDLYRYKSKAWQPVLANEHELKFVKYNEQHEVVLTAELKR